jgi:hypothetical protein
MPSTVVNRGYEAALFRTSNNGNRERDDLGVATRVVTRPRCSYKCEETGCFTGGARGSIVPWSRRPS